MDGGSRRGIDARLDGQSADRDVFVSHAALSGLADELKITLVAGSLALREGERLVNRSMDPFFNVGSPKTVFFC